MDMPALPTPDELRELEGRLGSSAEFELVKLRAAAVLDAWKAAQAVPQAAHSVPEVDDDPRPPVLSDLLDGYDIAKHQVGVVEYELLKSRVMAVIERDKAAGERAADREDALSTTATTRDGEDRAREHELVTKVHDAYIEVAKGALDRVQKRAEFLAGGAAAVTTAYSGVLALTYGKDATVATQPALGLVPAFFLATSVLFAIMFATHIKGRQLPGLLVPSNPASSLAEYRLQHFLEWMFVGVVERRWMVRVAQIALAGGIFTLPLPFVARGIDPALAIGGIALGLLVVVIWYLATSSRYVEPSTSQQPARPER